LSGWYDCAKVIKCGDVQKKAWLLETSPSNGQSYYVTVYLAWSVMEISVVLFHPKRNVGVTGFII
jgi:hypothetical protein